MRIWFNHWFSTAYHLINMMKEGNPDKFTMVGSSHNPLAIYKRACDEWYDEAEKISEKDYIEFCLDFCREHKIDIFVPRRNLAAVVKNAGRFEAAGVKLFADTRADIAEMLNNKLDTYNYFKKNLPDCIPEFYVAHSYDEFVKFYEIMKDHVSRVCYKLVVDEGARSFRVIDNRIESPYALLERPGSKVTFETAKAVLSPYDFSNPVLMMPYLEGTEVSVDCLKTPSGNLMIPRHKTNKRYSEVIFDKEIMQMCSDIMDMLDLKMPMNIQFKKHEDKFYLLEINPRMSGGLQLSCKATGINLPDIAINQLLGIEKPWSYPDIKSQKVAHIETPICLS